MLHVPVAYEVVPEGAELINVVPKGQVSVTVKLVACADPLLVTLIE